MTSNKSQQPPNELATWVRSTPHVIAKPITEPTTPTDLDSRPSRAAIAPKSFETGIDKASRASAAMFNGLRQQRGFSQPDTEAITKLKQQRSAEEATARAKARPPGLPGPGPMWKSASMSVTQNMQDYYTWNH
jgi:hypothetical protein